MAFLGLQHPLHDRPRRAFPGVHSRYLSIIWSVAAFCLSQISARALQAIEGGRFVLTSRLYVTWALSVPACFLIGYSEAFGDFSLNAIWITVSAFEFDIGRIPLILNTSCQTPCLGHRLKRLRICLGSRIFNMNITFFPGIGTWLIHQ